MSTPCRILIMGASYGSLLATKLVLAGHDATLICLPAEADLINRDGARVRMPVRGHDELVEIDSRKAPGKLTAAGPGDVDPSDFDLVALAMQEPQYRAPEVRKLLDAVARSRVPCMSIMNMPPHAYLKRLPGLDTNALRDCYTDASVWDSFDPKTITLASPDPQAFRPPEEPVNVLQVSLPTNFKVARFDSDKDTALLRRLEDDIQAVRFDVDGKAVELPVKLKVHDSVFVPLAKWCMLLTGNYRCVGKDAARSIKEAVHTDLKQSREVYEWVADLCRRMGAKPEDQVPFDKYANAALGLSKPSSAARALFAGAPNIERVDRVVQGVAKQHGLRSPVVDEIVALVDARLALNRNATA
jgi:ketopantoate reductase